MEQQRGRNEWKGSGEEALLPVYKELRAELGPTQFTGYTEESAAGLKVIAIVGALRGRPGRLSSASAGAKVELILDRTPFYGKSGGQEGDRGAMQTAEAVIMVVDAAKHFGDFIVHTAEIRNGSVRLGDMVDAQVSRPRRSRVKAAHSATHLLHGALRKMLGDHVKQAGSMVDEDHLRFDFHHFSPLTHEEIAAVEDDVNARIRSDIERRYHVDIPVEEAVRSGAMALFGEKYGDHVRMVEIGESRELCGGTHIDRTGEIGLFKIASEASVAAGVRRIEGFTGHKAEQYVRSGEHVLRAAAARLRCAPGEVDSKVAAQADRIKGLEREIETLRDKISAADSKSAAGGARDVAGVRAISVRIENADPGMMRGHADKLKEQVRSGVILIGTERDGKASFVCGVTPDLTKRFSAGKIIKEIAAIVGGSGGGRPDMAQAGGPDTSKIAEALEKFYSIVEAQG
jgi:alanyl-tRNA synthetase